MIFMYLGFLFLAFWSFSQARGKLAATFVHVQKQWAQNQEGGFVLGFLKCFGFAILSTSPHQNRLTAMALLGAGRWSSSLSLVLIGLSSLGVFIWAGLLSAVFQGPAGIFMLVGFLAVLIPKKWPSLISFLWFVFFLGLFLHSMETALRMSSFLGQEPFYQELSLMLADNRLTSVLGWLLISAAVTFFVPYEAWSWLICVLAISLGIMGFSVALGFVIGESLGACLVFLRVVHNRAPHFRSVPLQYFLVNLAAAVIFLFLFGLFRGEIYELSSLGGGALAEKVAWFLISVLAWSGFSVFCAMIWGHFKALTPLKGTFPVQILPTFVQELFSLSQN